MSNLDKKYTIKLDTKNSYFNAVPTFSLSDNETSDFNIIITNGNKIINLHNVIVVIVAINPNNEMYSDFVEVEKVEEGLLYCNLKEAFKNIAGVWNARLMLIYEDEKVVTGTFSYKVNTDEFVQLNELTLNDDRFPVLTDIVSRLSAIEIQEDNRQEAETNRVGAEIQREIVKQQLISNIENLIADTNLKVQSSLEQHNNNVNKLILDTGNKIDDYKIEKDTAIEQDLQQYKTSTTANIETYKNDKDIEINQKLELYKTSTTADIEIYKNSKNTEINQYKNDKDLAINNYISNKNSELDKYVSDKNIELDTSENIRVASENIRVQDENIRISNENIRIQGENVRIASEKVRVQGENVRISNENIRVSEHNKSIEDVDLKINDVEKRFQTLTTSQQQASEVIEARDGEICLKARLDRDLAKGKIIEENANESHITVLNSVKGNITNIEVLGNTIQGISDLSDIQSVGTLQEDGRYKMSILSCGKNFTNPVIQNGMIQGSNGLFDNGVSPDYCSSVNYDYIKPTKQYFISSDKTIDAVFYYNKDRQYISNQSITLKGKQLAIPSNCYYIRYRFLIANKPNWVQIEEGTQATSYEPYQENKSSILLPCQLEKVGTVSDRLFRREDGVWCVEKNIGDFLLDGTGNWSIGTEGDATNGFTIYSAILSNLSRNELNNINNKLKNVKWNSIKTSDTDFLALKPYNSTADICIFNKMGMKSKEECVSWLTQNNILVKYALATPQIIELPLDVQIQLNSFNGVTNIFTEDTVIEPTIKATVPKSLGASVQSLVNKTDILSDRVEAVETLKEGTELEVVTESGYVVCENSNNGQIDGLKVEGKTLVNLCKNLVQGGLSGTDGLPTVNSFRVRLADYLDVKQNQTYTVLTFGDCAIRNYALGDGETYLSSENILTQSCVINTLSNTSLNVAFYKKSSDVTAITPSECKVLILEGDHTQNPPSYFEGLKSVGDGVDKIEVLSRKEDENLFDGVWLKEALDASTGNASSSVVDIASNFIPIQSNITYDMYNNKLARVTHVYYYDKNKNFIRRESYLTSFTPILGDCYVRLYGVSTDRESFVLKKKSVLNKLLKYQSNKKQILFKNSSGVYEKPVLRSTGAVSDTIEKHSDGKYYFHKRCGEVVLNGSENWKLASKEFYYVVGNNYPLGGIIADKIPVLPTNYTTYPNNTYAITLGGNSYGIIIRNDTHTSLDTFKTWLQSNPVTIVYQLATEEVYECVNLDLDSYEGETSVIFDGGAISPKLTFKIASHIANTIQVLKDRINYLEDKVIAMLKSVLAGDTQTLAYELYPEDFEEDLIIDEEFLVDHEIVDE